MAGWTMAAALAVALAASSRGGGVIGRLLSPANEPRAAAPVLPRAAPEPLAAPGPGIGPEVELRSGPGGNFHTMAEIDGTSLPMIVDTGASMVVLSYEQADRLGIRPFPSDFVLTSQTANGEIRLAKVTLSSVRVGQIEVRDVVAAVAPEGAVGGEGLLGMTFLDRLRSYRVDSGRLVLRN